METSASRLAVNPKPRWRRVDGVLLLDKDLGLSSNTALQKARRLFAAAKGGHTGTLDPLASGLLPLCFGEASKFAADLLDADKTYTAEITLGVVTTTGDREGEILATAPVSCTEQTVIAALSRFVGEIQQIPPMYSALKRDGKPLYELARAGASVERPARLVRVHALECLALDLPRLTLSVTCSKGTYIRVLAEDIGAALGCGAHLSALRRTRVGDLDIADAHTLAELEAKPENERLSCLAPVDRLIARLPALALDAQASERFRHGNPVAQHDLPRAEKIRVYAEEVASSRLLGLGIRKADGRLWPQRLIVNQ